MSANGGGTQTLTYPPTPTLGGVSGDQVGAGLPPPPRSNEAPLPFPTGAAVGWRSTGEAGLWPSPGDNEAATRCGVTGVHVGNSNKALPPPVAREISAEARWESECDTHGKRQRRVSLLRCQQRPTKVPTKAK